MMQFLEDARQFLPILLEGATTTIALTILSLALSTVLGLVLALMRMSRQSVILLPAIIIIGVLRGVPILIQLMYVYFVLPMFGLQLDAFTAGVVGLGVGFSGYHAENFRGAILAVSHGQREAALSIGMNKVQILRRIVLPQAARIGLPSYGNLTIMMLKDSSLASVITVAEITHVSQLIASATFKNLTVFTLAALIYLAMSVPLATLNSWLERNFALK